MLLQRYPLTAMLSQEIGEELPGMIGGAATAKFGLKSGKLAKTAEKLSDVSYKKLAAHSALGGFTDGLIVDPAQAQEFNMTPEQRRASRFTNAYTGAVLAPTINLGTKGIHDIGGKSINAVKKHTPKLAKATKDVSAKVYNNAKELYNSANDRFSDNTAFDSMKKISKGDAHPVKDNLPKNAVITTGGSAFDVWKNLPKEKAFDNNVPVSKPEPKVENIAPKTAEKQKNLKQKESINEGTKTEFPSPETEPVVLEQTTPLKKGSKIPQKVEKESKVKITSTDITPEIINKYKEKFPYVLDIIPSDVEGKYLKVLSEDNHTYISDEELKAVANFEIDKNAPYPDHDSVSLYTPILDDKYNLVFRKNLTKKSKIEVLFDRVGEKEFNSFGEVYDFIKKHKLDVENISTYEKEIRKLDSENITQKIAPKTAAKQKSQTKPVKKVKEGINLKDLSKGDYVVDTLSGEKYMVSDLGLMRRVSDNVTVKLSDDKKRIFQKYTPTKKLPQKPARIISGDNKTRIDYDRHIYEGWTVKDFIDELEKRGIDDVMKGESIYSPFKNRDELKKWCMDNQPYYKKYIPDVVNHFAQKYNLADIETDTKKHDKKGADTSVETVKNVIIEDSKKQKGTLNGHISATDELRPGRAKKKSATTEENGAVRKGKSRTNGSVSEIGRIDDTGIQSDGRLISEHEELINASYKKQQDLNKAIEKFITDKEYEKYKGEIPSEIKNWIKKYTGAGGLEKQGAQGKGLLSEYYTPEDIVKQTWDLVKNYTDTDGSKILEPSVGIGRFFDYAPVGSSLHGIEMNPVSAKIAELLHPNAKIENALFQERFIDKTKNIPLKKITPEYDIVIGNPPYGKYSGRYKGMGEGKGIEQTEQYFIKRGLDVLKDDGILAYVVPSSFLKNEATKSKLEIAKNAVILDAVRLPEETFETTTIGTDIIILKKNAK